MSSKKPKSCAVCGISENEPCKNPFSGEPRKAKVHAYHVIPKSWTALAEFKDLTVPLCTRCHSCCPPSTIASYNQALSYEVARVFNNLFPALSFDIIVYNSDNVKCPIIEHFVMDIIKK